VERDGSSARFPFMGAARHDERTPRPWVIVGRYCGYCLIFSRGEPAIEKMISE
jgi:hypothetical protein